MGPFDVLVLQWSVSLSQFAMGKKQTKIAWTQVGVQILWDDSGDDENDQGEEWMENPLIYNKLMR